MPVNCDASLAWANDIQLSYPSDTLQALCTSTCKTSLSDWLGRVKTVCGTSRYLADDGYSYLAVYGAELAVERYQVICLQNSAGKNCNSVLASLAGIDPAQMQKSTAAPQPNMACNDCAISLLKTRLEMPLMSNDYLSSAFSVITSSCKTSVAVTKPGSTAWITSATATTTTATPTSSCTGKIYTLKPGDTCLSVSLSQGIDTVRLLVANNLLAGCVGFPTTGSLCIPTAWTCKAHQVKLEETCETIAKANNVSWAQLIAWNRELDRACQNIFKQVNMAICISNPGGDWVDPFPTTTTTQPDISTTTSDTVFTLVMTPVPASLMDTTIRVSTIWGDNDDL